MILPLNGGDVVDGVVARRNERGLILEGEDVWLNVSRYAKPSPALPLPGERVRLYLDKDGYIRDVDRISYAVRGAAEDGVDVPPPDDEVPSRQIEATPPSGAVSPPDKDVRSTRMNALTTATAILSSGGRACEVADVLRLAAQLEAWVNR
jgi:hypothetical protein